MPRPLKRAPGERAFDELCDGKQFLSVDQVAARTGQSPEAIRKAAERHHLSPGNFRGMLVFTGTDVERYQRWRSEHTITRQLADGRHPLDIYLEGDGQHSLDGVLRVLSRWAKLSGAWLVEGPRGSYARWLDRMGLVRMKPRDLRRIIEALCVDEYVRRVVLGLEPVSTAAKRPNAPARQPLAMRAGPSSLPPPQ